jgi:N-acetylglucosaminyl-diphospho-decaprenol L-rhamnosyltransferase
VNNHVVGLLLNYRDAKRSVRCAQSLCDEGVEHVVVWDNSGDGDVSAAEIYELAGDKSWLDLQVSQINLGFSAGVNRALQHCARHYPGCWILLINNDAYLVSGALRKLVRALEMASSAELALPAINHSGRVLGMAYYHRLTGFLTWTPRRGCFAYGSGCCLLIATDRIDTPLFDEDFFMYGEDWALGWHLHQRGGAMVFVDETLVIHEGAASSGLGSMFYETQMVAAHLILVRKLASSTGERMLLYFARAVMLGARALIRAVRFRSSVPLSALLRGWQGAARTNSNSR